MRVLAQGPIFEITANTSVVRCSVVNRDDVSPEEGARCAELMQSTLRHEVLGADNRYAGLVFDVTRGPAVFGPRTRSALELLFRGAESRQRRIAVVVGPAAIQELQFASLCRECAPTQGRVFKGAGAEDWASGMSR